MQEHKKRNADIYAALIVLVLLLAFGLQLKNINVEIDYYYPAFLVVAISILLVLLIIKIFVSPDKRVIFNEHYLKRIGFGALVSAVWIAVLNTTGFYTAAFVAMTIISLKLDKNFTREAVTNTKTIIILKTMLVTFIIIVITYFVFTRALSIPTPKGFLI